jgi:tetratricopeptide (TPR) repeat protein
MSKQYSNVDTTKELEATGGESGGFLQGNIRLLGFIGIGLLVLVGLITYFTVSSGSTNDRAQMELARIRPYYDRGEFALAINGDSSKRYGNEKVRGLRGLVDEYGSTKAGKIAALFLGNCYLSTQQLDQAKAAFETATESDAPIVQSGAHAGLAAVWESMGKYDQAAQEYDKAATEDRLDLNTPNYLVGAARNYEKAGKKEEAIKNYRTVATRYANSSANTEARLALARNNVEL